MFKYTKKWKEIGNNFNVSLRKNNSKKSSYFLEFKDNEPIVIQLPKSKIVSNGILKSYKKNISYIDLELGTEECYKLFENIEEKILKILVSRGDLFFEGVNCEEQINIFALEEMFKYSLRVGGKMRIRIDLSSCQLFDSSGVKIEDFDRVRKDDEIICSIYSDYVKITNGIIKINWYLCQMKVNKVISDCVIEDSDEDNNIGGSSGESSDGDDEFGEYRRF